MKKSIAATFLIAAAAPLSSEAAEIVQQFAAISTAPIPVVGINSNQWCPLITLSFADPVDIERLAVNFGEEFFVGTPAVMTASRVFTFSDTNPGVACGLHPGFVNNSDPVYRFYAPMAQQTLGSTDVRYHTNDTHAFAWPGVVADPGYVTVWAKFSKTAASGTVSQSGHTGHILRVP